MVWDLMRSGPKELDHRLRGRAQGLRGFRGFRVLGFQGFLVLGFQGVRILGFRVFGIWGFRGFRLGCSPYTNSPTWGL